MHPLLMCVFPFHRLPLPSKSADWTHFGGNTLTTLSYADKGAIIKTAGGALFRHD